MDRFIDGREENGIQYDWKKIKATYNKLKIPTDLYNASYIPCEDNAWNVILSERSTGKTTNIMLLGLCMKKEYPQTQIVYMREFKDDITKSAMDTFFSVINTYNKGKYIKFLTNEKYNHITYNSQGRFFYYSYIDENDDEIARSDAIVYCLSGDMSDNRRSTLNLPYGDFIVFDEFITEKRLTNDTLPIFNLIKTIIRERLSPRIFAIANTVSPYSQFFDDLEIQHDVTKMSIGDTLELVTERGTHIFVELCGLKQSERKRKSNKMFFGFSSGRLNAITGGVAWNYDIVPHIKHRKNKTYISRNIYFEHIYTYRIDTVYDEERQTYILEVHECTKPYTNERFYYDDSIILVNDAFKLLDNRYIMINGTISNNMQRLYDRGLLYFDNNATHTSFKYFFKLR